MDRYIRPQPRKYFSERHGRGPKGSPLAFEQVLRLAIATIDGLFERGYFQQSFGYYCVDADWVEGSLGRDPDEHFLKTLLRSGIWPWDGTVDYGPHDGGEGFVWQFWDEDTLFDVIEVLFDLVSKPVSGTEHTHNGCGWHYNTFSSSAGKAQFRDELNEVLRLGASAYEISADGEIIEAAPDEFRNLLGAEVPAGADHDRITSKVQTAVRNFRTRGVSLDDRRQAVRDLADVLEALRPDIKTEMFSKDEDTLFNIANNFAIRHHDNQQKTRYDGITWLTWMFYVNLATIHAVLRVRQSQSAQLDSSVR